MDEKPLEIKNMVVAGRIKFNKKLSLEEVNKLIQTFNWVSINELNPLLYREFKELNEIRPPNVMLWTSGAISIYRITNKRDADKIHGLVLDQLKQVCPKNLG